MLAEIQILATTRREGNLLLFPKALTNTTTTHEP